MSRTPHGENSGGEGDEIKKNKNLKKKKREEEFCMADRRESAAARRVGGEGWVTALGPGQEGCK